MSLDGGSLGMRSDALVDGSFSLTLELDFAIFFVHASHGGECPQRESDTEQSPKSITLLLYLPPRAEKPEASARIG